MQTKTPSWHVSDPKSASRCLVHLSSFLARVTVPSSMFSKCSFHVLLVNVRNLVPRKTTAFKSTGGQRINRKGIRYECVFRSLSNRKFGSVGHDIYSSSTTPEVLSNAKPPFNWHCMQWCSKKEATFSCWPKCNVSNSLQALTMATFPALCSCAQRSQASAAARLCSLRVDGSRGQHPEPGGSQAPAPGCHLGPGRRWSAVGHRRPGTRAEAARPQWPGANLNAPATRRGTYLHSRYIMVSRGRLKEIQAPTVGSEIKPALFAN